METMKNKLIDYKTGEETLCDKVTVDGYDYYVSDEKYIEDELLYCVANGWLQKARVEHLVEQRGNDNQWKKIIATTNPNIDDVPKVVDEVTEMAYNWLYDEETENKASQGYPLKPMEYGFIKGYTKSQETHPFSEEDMIEFAEWIANSKLHGYSKQLYEAMIRHKVSTTKELLQIWKEQKIKTLNKDEYIIINKTAIQKRIDELIEKANTYKKEELEIMYIGCQFQIKVYKEILSQSIPLIPEIEKAIDYGIRKSFGSKKHSEIRQEYISNLKLDI